MGTHVHVSLFVDARKEETHSAALIVFPLSPRFSLTATAKMKDSGNRSCANRFANGANSYVLKRPAGSSKGEMIRGRKS